MGLLNKKICPKCGEEFSPLRSECPKCGAAVRNRSLRAGAQSDTIKRGSSAQKQQETDSRWQLIFGLCLVAAVIIAVIILIMTTINGGYETYATPTPSQDIVESPTPPPTSTPPPSPTPTVESITITYLGDLKESFAMHIGDTPIPLRATIYPIEIEGAVTWSSSNEGVCTVDAEGNVSAVGSGTAKIIARCYGAASECEVLVW